ncbi:hypothetical protein [Streptomyces rubiginosohelvolus]|uniref:Uncharacterized protein n=1 Tax=Streptomyces rubiginosohelvolus TaxID=67362 RepID=A0ABQ3CCL3_9ACTN|nr:hypothetical protein [Streptomyces pluricolorescens]GGZ83609.1 hypothetical protein GCM10010328_67350 [Streptomyces pluricolorescens]
MQTYGPTMRYHCPLDCGWHHDAPQATGDDNLNQYTQGPDEAFPDVIARMAADTARLHIEQIDAVLLGHLNTHTIPQFVAALAKQREAMYEAGENSGHADWDNALGDLLPDDVEPLPTQVAEYVQKLQQENARLRATTKQ